MLEPINGKAKKDEIINMPDIKALALIRNKIAMQYVETTALKKPVRKRQIATKKNIEIR